VSLLVILRYYIVTGECQHTKPKLENVDNFKNNANIN